MSHWLYEGKPFTEVPEKAFGFVYLITNLTNNKKYIGRKQFNSRRRKPLTKKQKQAGRVKRTVQKTESDWREYTGSHHPLNEDIKRLGKQNFKFEILVIGYTKGQCNYVEEYLQYNTHAAMSSEYYNDCIGSGKHRNTKIPTQIITELRNINKK